MHAVHTKVSALADSGNGNLVQPSDWNATQDVLLDGSSSAAPSTITPTFSQDFCEATGLTGAVTIAAPTGTAKNRWGLVIALKDNGTQRAITWNGIYRPADGVTLPANTTVGKWTYVSMIYCATDTKWDVLSTALVSV